MMSIQRVQGDFLRFESRCLTLLPRACNPCSCWDRSDHALVLWFLKILNFSPSCGYYLAE